MFGVLPPRPEPVHVRRGVVRGRFQHDGAKKEASQGGDERALIMGILNFFFGNATSEPVNQKPRTGFRNQSGEELAIYLTESDIQLLNNAVDSNGGVTAEIVETLKCVKYYKKVLTSTQPTWAGSCGERD